MITTNKICIIRIYVNLFIKYNHIDIDIIQKFSILNLADIGPLLVNY